MGMAFVYAPIVTDPRVYIPPDLHNLLLVQPIPRNMHPEHNIKCREHRTRVLARKYPMGQSTAYVDATSYTRHNAYAVTAIFDPKATSYHSLTIQTRSPATVEEAAIALASAYPNNYLRFENGHSKFHPEDYFPAGS